MRVRVPQFGAKTPQFVLFIGDEGAILVHMLGRRVIKRLFSPNADPSNVRGMLDLLTAHPRTKLRLLVDVMDQSYVRHPLPPVSSLSVGKLIKRRLERDFPQEDIKGALFIDREKEGRKDWNYLLIALAQTPLVAGWLDWVNELPNPLAGIHLAPVEGEQYIRRLADALQPQREAAPHTWQLLVSHHKVGGFRQVVLKDGKLIFTRLAQPIGETVPEVIAGNIEQEVSNTIEYLKRLSFDDEQPLDMYIVVSENIKQAIDRKKFKAAFVEILTPYEAAEALELEQAALPSDHFGDVVMVAAFAAERRHRLTLFSTLARRLHQLHMARRAVRFAAAAAAMLMLLSAAATVWELWTLREEERRFAGEQQVAQRQLEALQAEVKTLPENIDRITDVVSIYELFSKKDRGPMDFAVQLKPALAEGIHVSELHWAMVPGKVNPSETYLAVKMSVMFSRHEGKVKQFVTSVQAFLDRLKQQFPGYRVAYEKLPGVLGDTDALEISFDKDSVTLNQDTFDADTPMAVVFTLTDEPAS